MATILLFGDTVRSPALRHEVPLEIVDPFLYVARGDDAFVLTSALELGLLPRAGTWRWARGARAARARARRRRDAGGGDVVAIEPGVEGIEGLGGVRFEDLLLITDDECETLTDYPYEL